MLTANLLISTSVIKTLIIVAASVFAFASFFYGVFKKFTQMSWIAWQIPIIFLPVLFLNYFFKFNDKWQLTLTLILLAAFTVAVLGGGALLRVAMHKRMRPAHSLLHFFDRLLGGITALLDYVILVGIVGSVVLSVFYYAYPLEFLSFLYNTGIWHRLAPFVFDFFLVSMLVLAFRTGWRVGFGRVLLIVLMIAFVFGAMALSVFLTLRTSLFRGMARAIAGSVHGNATVSKVVGYGVTAIILFVILFILVCVLFWLFNKLRRRIRYNRFWGLMDGGIGAAFSFVVVLLFVFAVDTAIAWLASGSFLKVLGEITTGKINEFLMTWGGNLRELVVSSPFSRLLYLLNPFIRFVA